MSEGTEPVSEEFLSAWLVDHLAEALEIPEEDIDLRQPFSEYGLSSVEAVSLTGDLENLLGRKLSPTLAWEYPSIENLARHLANTQAVGQEVEPPNAPHLTAGIKMPETAITSEPIAIIGIGCRFPGADGPDAFWRMLVDGVDAIREVPADRWNIQSYYDPDPSLPGKMNTRWGGFLEGIHQFDPQFFGISPREAARMDPQQRILLEVAWEALENAGLARERIAGTRTGVFIGISGNEYSLSQMGDTEQIDAYTGTGNALSIAANRISYFFDFQGPSLAVDTACSSSLTAVHLACSSIRRGEADLALAGGVNVILSPAMGINFTKAGAMAPDGRCKAFDASADGYVRSEGAGLVVLKPLSQALKDHDQIYAMIRGSAINQDGHTNGLMAPNPLSQERLIRQACEQAGVLPGQVQFVEAHGTGTLLGDPIEAKALGTVLAEGRKQGERCWVGSVKTNIGHMEAAAGAAGLIKAALSLHHRTIPPNLHFKSPNPYIPFETLPLSVPQAAIPWPEGQGPTLAGVSSFGFGGTNVHMILEAAPGRAKEEQTAREEEPGAYLLPLSAQSPQALHALAEAYGAALLSQDVTDSQTLRYVCYSASVRRSHHDHRLALTGSTLSEVAEALGAYLSGEEHSSVKSGAKVSTRAPGVVFVFPGQGAQWLGMGTELIAQEPVFREALERCDEAVRAQAGWSILEKLNAPVNSTWIGEIDIVQPVLFAIQVGLAELWRSWGIQPGSVIGHSMGEAAAACVAGAITLEEAARIICCRSRLLKRVSGKGAMAAVSLPVRETEEALAEFGPRLCIAVSNSPASTVVAGDPETLQALAQKLHRQNVPCRPVKVDVAAHSPQVEPLVPELVAALSGLNPQAGKIPLISTVTGSAIPGSELGSDYWGRNLREPVLFSPAMKSLVADGYHIFLEISPHPVLLGPMEEGLHVWEQPGRVLASLRRGESERLVLMRTLGALYVLGCPIRWERLYPEGGELVSLPAYPWQRQKYEFRPDAGQPAPIRSQAREVPLAAHPLLGRHIELADSTGKHLWEGALDPNAVPYLDEHRIYGRKILPAGAYLEMYLSALARQDGSAHPMGERAGIMLENLEFQRLLVLPDNGASEVQVILTRREAAQILQVYSHPLEYDEKSGNAPGWALFSECTLEGEAAGSTGLPEASLDLGGIRERCKESVPVDRIYRELEQRNVQYGASFRRLAAVWKGAGEAVAKLHVPEEWERDGIYQVHPVISDACFQTMAAAAGWESDSSTASENELYLPTHIQKIRFVRSPKPDPLWCYASVHPGDQADRRAVEGDIWLTDGDGHPVLILQGVRFQQAGGDLPAAGPGRPEDWLYEIDWLPVPNHASGAGRTGEWLILADHSGVAQALAEQLRARQQGCILVRKGEKFTHLPSGDFSVHPGESHEMEQLLEAVTHTGVPLQGLIHCWGVDAPSPDGTQVSELARSQASLCAGAISLVQALSRIGQHEPPRLWIITRGAQPANGFIPALEQAALWGLGRTIAQEHPSIWGGLVDLEAGGDLAVNAALLAQQVCAPDGEDQLSIRQGQRFAARLARREEIRSGAPPLRLDPGGSYLISGGLGDLGLLSARWIAAQGGKHLALLGRTSLPPRKEWSELDPGSRQGRRAAAVLELEALGAGVTLAAVDVSDAAALRLFIEDYVRSGHPPIRGVIHTAGVLEDRLLAEMEPQALERAFQAKIQGGWALHRALQHVPLDFFVLFSSVASLFSQHGQGNYAAANAFLDALARYRRAQGLPALAVNWGPWKDLGFAATQGGRRLVAALTHLGVQSLEPGAAFEALELLLAQQAVQAAVLPVDWQKYRAKSSPESIPLLLQRLAGSRIAAPASMARAATAVRKSKLPSQLQGLPFQEQAELLVHYLCQRIGRVMQMPETAISAKRNILELGLDSIMVMELVRELERDLQIKLYPREIFERPSVEALAEYLAAEFNRSQGATAAAVVDGTSIPQTAAAVQKLARQASRVQDIRPIRRNSSVVFLLSAPRSGSTLLRVMLAGHPGLFCPPELHLLPFNTLGEWKEKLGRTYLDEGLIRAFMELKNLDPESGKQFVQSLVDQDMPVQEVYALLQNLAYPRMLVDKSPSYAANFATLQRAEVLFDAPRYIFLVRHPYTMIRSSVEMRIDRLVNAEEADPYRFSEQVWATSNSNTLDFVSQLAGERFRLVRFEELVGAPEREARGLCDFLGIPFYDSILKPYEGARMTDGVYTESMGVGDPNFLKHEGIDPALGEAWQEVRLPHPLGSYARHVAAELGYPLPNETRAGTRLAWQGLKQDESIQAIQAAQYAQGISQGFPLSFAQERLWFLEKLAPGTALYNVPALACQLLGRLDVSAMEKTLGEIVRRQASLRTRFPEVEGRPLQQIDPWQPFTLPVIDLMHLPVEQRQAEALRQATGLVQRTFDLAKGPLFEAALFRLAPEDHLFVMPMHHIITDGWSIGVLAYEIEALYTAAVRGGPPPLPDLPVQYTDFAVWQHERLQEKVLEELLEYWKGQLSGLPPALELLLDHPRPAVQTFPGMRLPFAIPPDTLAGLKALSAENRATLFMTLLAAFETLLYRYTGQEDFAVGTPIAGRSQPETRALIGLFGNTLVFRSNLDGGWSFVELLSQVRETALGAYENQELPFEKLVQGLQPERNLGRSPLFQVMFILQNEPYAVPSLPGLEVVPIDLDVGTAKFDLSVSLLEGERGLTGWFEFNTDLFDPATIQRMQEHFRILLAGVIAAPSQRLDELPLLSPGEMKQVLEDWNSTVTAYPGEACLPDLFEAQAARSPGQPAVVFGGQSCTYQELERRANGLANLLQQAGIGPDVLVALSMERSIDMATAVLGVLKAGGAYVPLDPAYPAERLAYVLADTHAPVLLTQSHLAQQLPEHTAQVVCLDAIDWQSLQQNQPPERAITPESLAYVIYTSGSTGRPKGIAMPHRPLVNLIQWQLQHWTFPAQARTLQYASLSFDVSFQEIFSTWSSGGALFMISEDLRRDPYELLVFLGDQKIERLFLPFVALQQLAETSETYAQAPLPRALRDIITAGEQLQITPQITGLFERLDGCVLHNHYGPTETHVVSAYTLEGAPQEWQRLPPIGRPIANTQLYILNSGLQPVPPGCSGELYIGGACLSRGYLNRPELTAEKFVPNRFSLGEKGNRGIGDRGQFSQSNFPVPLSPIPLIYRTGDLARWLPDGNIEYLGRSDDQVKIRGFRVEPGEIEVLLGKHPAVRQVAVVPRRSPAGDHRLVAYVVTRGEAAGNDSDLEDAFPQQQPPGSQALLPELQDLARQQLPEYMLPSAYVFSEGLPVTPSGKINRRALPEPDWAQPVGTGNLTPPQTRTEKKIAAIWAELLGAEPQDIHVSFFDAGGHSLLALQLVGRIRQALGVDIPLRQLFIDATIAGLGRAVDELNLPVIQDRATPEILVVPETGRASLPPSLVAVQPQGDRPPFFCIHPAGGLVYLYYELAYQIGLEQPFWGIQDMSLAGQVEPYSRVEDYAAEHLQSIRALQPEGPYYLGGWSFGGLIAYEIACRLRQQGQPVAFLALLDTEVPLTLQGASIWKKIDYRWRNMAAYLAGTREAISFLRDGWYLASRYLHRKKENAEQLNFAEQVRLLSLSVLRNSFLRQANVGLLLAQHPVLFEVPVPTTATSQFLKVFRANARIYHRYRPQPYPGKVTLIQGDLHSTRRNLLYGKDSTLGWSRLVTDGLEIRTVPGNHMVMFQKPYVVDLARVLKAELERAQMEARQDDQAARS